MTKAHNELRVVDRSNNRFRMMSPTLISKTWYAIPLAAQWASNLVVHEIVFTFTSFSATVSSAGGHLAIASLSVDVAVTVGVH